jgi:plastocyanin
MIVAGIRSRRRFGLRRSVALLALALLAVACGEGTEPAATAPRSSSSVPPNGAMERPSHPEAKVVSGAQDYYEEVAVKGSRFSPATYSLSLSEQVALTNHDSVLHNITIPASGISDDVEPGEEIYTRPITLRPGKYAFYCRIHGAAGMRGTFTMTSNRDVIIVRRGY